MPSAWITYVKKFASEHKMKFGEALADKRCSASYKSLQTSAPNKGPMSFVPVDAAPNKKPLKRTKSKSSSKRSQPKNNAKSRSNKKKSKSSKSKRSNSKRSKSRN